MKNHKRIQDADNNLLPSELVDLGRMLDELDVPNRNELNVAWERVAESVLRRRRILNLVQEALAQLRLDVKYLMFDLEITRKERDELQTQIEEDEL